MKKIILSLFIVLSFQGLTKAQDSTEFYDYISRVDFVDYGFNEAVEKSLISSPEGMDIVNALTNYLKTEFGIKGAIVTNEQRTEVYRSTETICKISVVGFELGEFNSKLMAIGFFPFDIKFWFCDGKEFQFSTQLNVTGNTTSFTRPLKKGLDSVFLNKPKQIVKGEILKIQQGEMLVSDQSSEETPFENSDEIFGVYELISASQRIPIKKFGILNKDNQILIYQIENSFFKNDWAYGEYRGKLSLLRPNVYKGELLSNMKLPFEITLIKKADGIVELTNLNDNDTFQFAKISN